MGACSTLQSPSSGRGGKCTITACSLFSRWKKHQEQRLRSKLLYQQVERQSAVKHQQVTVREQHPQAVEPLDPPLKTSGNEERSTTPATIDSRIYNDTWTQ